MITLKTTDKTEARAIFEKEEITFCDYSDCLCAKDKDEVLGYCLFDIKDGEMTIRAIEPQNDLMLLDGILRSTLHIAASRNLKSAVWADKAPEKIFRTLGFVTDDDKLNTNKLYESGCSCCKK